MATVPKSKLDCDTPTGASPVPRRTARRPPPDTSSTPLIGPTAFGEMLTSIVQLPFAGSVAGQLLVCEYGAVTVIALTVRLAPPAFNVIVCGALPEPPGFTSCGGKVKTLGESDAGVGQPVKNRSAPTAPRPAHSLVDTFMVDLTVERLSERLA